MSWNSCVDIFWDIHYLMRLRCRTLRTGSSAAHKNVEKKIKYLQGPSQNSYIHHKEDIFVLEVSPRAATSEMLSVPENGRSNKSVTTNPADLIDLFGPNLTAYYNFIM